MGDQADKVDPVELDADTPVKADAETSEASVASEAPEPPAAAEPTEAPAPKRADVLRDFRQAFANRHQHGGGKRQKPAGGNPRFK